MPSVRGEETSVRHQAVRCLSNGMASRSHVPMEMGSVRGGSACILKELITCVGICIEP